MPQLGREGVSVSVGGKANDEEDNGRSTVILVVVYVGTGSRAACLAASAGIATSK